MIPLDARLLGNTKLHQQICLATGILAAVMRDMPHPVSMAALATFTGTSCSDLTRPCSRLWQAGLIAPAENNQGWILCERERAYTLADVWKSMTAAWRNVPARTGDDPDAARLPQAVEVFLGQATLAINQSLLRHLGQYSFDRFCKTGSLPQ